MAKEKNLEDLFHDTLKDIYYAERKILKALPKMKRAAQSEDLKAAFEKHREQTEGHVERSSKCLKSWAKRQEARLAMRSRELSPKAKRSWRNSRIPRRLTPA
ncbi:Domain of uncharacterised function (DUF892) [Brucella anthropi]|nr:Domain of uncharacterised function (DUF892) [Brucella anthropi]